MFVRIVKMVFLEDKVGDFLLNFNNVKEQIRNVPGCRFLELYRDKDNPQVFFTYSYWEREEDLENYRASALFKSVWADTKPLFAEKAEAWSVDKLVSME
jgi:(4S)-4-hydroxy-5-phosphonooxypentane-2,3-dione isomerase